MATIAGAAAAALTPAFSTLEADGKPRTGTAAVASSETGAVTPATVAVEPTLHPSSKNNHLRDPDDESESGKTFLARRVY